MSPKPYMFGQQKENKMKEPFRTRIYHSEKQFVIFDLQEIDVIYEYVYGGNKYLKIHLKSGDEFNIEHEHLKEIETHHDKYKCQK